MNFKSLATVLFACAAASAQAGFTNVVLLNNDYDATQPLTNGTVYVVENWASFLGKYDGKSGLAVAPGATVVIYVKKEDGTLWADSYKGEEGGAGGGAGIILPKDATLIITGPGKVSASGSSGTSGTRYSQGTVGSANENTCTAGRGGAGGVGGAGGGAGIGGAGGSGGYAGIAPEETPRETNDETFDLSGKNGNPGGAGGNGGDAGTVYLLGTASLSVQGGGGGTEINSIAQFAPGAKYDRGFWKYAFVVGGAAPGGEGAGGMAARAGIGGGGGGGGGGGSGGNGGYYCWLSGESAGWESEWPRGESGYGGKSADGTLDGGRYHPTDSVLKNGVDGGKGGAGGAAGANGTGGILRRMASTTFEGTVADDAQFTIHLADAPSAVKYDVIFNAGGYAGMSATPVVLGVAITNCIDVSAMPAVAPRFGKEFLGWFTEENGAGTKWFNADGTRADTAPELYETVGSTTLHAAWRDMQGFKAENYKLEPAGITVDGTSLVIPVGIENAANLDYALQFMKVRSSTSLPVSVYAPFENVEVETREDGGKAIVIPIKPNVPSKFYRIVVGE